MSSNKEDILDMVRLTENEVDIESADVLTCKHCREMEQLKTPLSLQPKFPWSHMP